MNVTSLHERELMTILSGFADYIEQRADQQKLDQLHHTWIPLLSTYVTHNAVESSLDEWHAMIESDFLWLHYIEEQLALTAKPVVRNTLKKWQKPFVFAGHRLTGDIYTCWSSGTEWQVQNACAAHLIGMALPMGEKRLLLVHCFETDEWFEELLEESFSETKETTRQHYLNHHYLTCLSLQSDNS